MAVTSSVPSSNRLGQLVKYSDVLLAIGMALIVRTMIVKVSSNVEVARNTVEDSQG